MQYQRFKEQARTARKAALAQGSLHPLAMLLHSRPEQDQEEDELSQVRCSWPHPASDLHRSVLHLQQGALMCSMARVIPEQMWEEAILSQHCVCRQAQPAETCLRARVCRLSQGPMGPS